MGNCCDCFSSGQKGPTPKTPLLTNAQPPSITVTSPPEGKGPAYDGIENGTSASAGQSARKHRPDVDQNDFSSSLEEISQIEVKIVQTVPSLDKTFQDHAKLYNDLYTNFAELRQCLHNFKAYFAPATNGIPTITECLKLLAQRCGGAELKGSRTKNCIQIECDRREVSEKCEGPAEEVLDIIGTYNKANRIIRSLLEKSPKVQSSLRLVLEQESSLKREVTKADPDGKMGPEPLKATTNNFTCFHRLPAYIDTIQKYTSKIFKEIVSGSRVLFADTP